MSTVLYVCVSYKCPPSGSAPCPQFSSLTPCTCVHAVKCDHHYIHITLLVYVRICCVCVCVHAFKTHKVRIRRYEIIFGLVYTNTVCGLLIHVYEVITYVCCAYVHTYVCMYSQMCTNVRIIAFCTIICW